MIRIAAIQPGDLASQYEVVQNRSKQMQLAGIGNTASELLQSAGMFDACVVHSRGNSASAVIEQQVEQLASAGKHVLLDVDRIDIATLEQYRSICKQQQVRLAITQRGRFSAYAQTINDDLRAGHLGGPGLVRIHRWSQRTSESDSSSLWPLAFDEVDLACWLFDAWPNRVFGLSIRAIEGVEGILIHLGFPQGMAILDCLLHSQAPYYSVSLIGSQGAAYADDHRNTNLLLKQSTQGLPVIDTGDWLFRQLSAFASQVESESNGHSIDECVRALHVAHAAVQSAESEKVASRVGDRYELA